MKKLIEEIQDAGRNRIALDISNAGGIRLFHLLECRSHEFAGEMPWKR
jgi:hypothetical protein